jgi:formylglycine-generating enzyme required for sulfatase activity
MQPPRALQSPGVLPPQKELPLPFVSLLPPSGTFVKGYSVEVRGVMDREGVPFVTVNGLRVKVIEKRFAVQVALEEGENRIAVEALAEGLKKADALLLVFADNEPPVLRIESPTDGLNTSKASVTIAGQVQDRYPDKVSIGGTDFPIKNERFQATVRLAEGENVLDIRAFDRAGSSVKKILRVQLDTMVTQISLDSYPWEIVSDSPEFELTGKVSEPLERLTVAGRPVPVQGKKFRGKVRLLEGHNRVVLEAFDRVGNRGRLEAGLRYVNLSKKKAFEALRSKEGLVEYPLIPPGLWWQPTREQKACALRSRLPIRITNSVGMPLVLIPPGTFTMGSPITEKGRKKNEIRHRVTLTRGFYMGATEVTNDQYRRFAADHKSGRFMGYNLNGDDQPVVEVTWYDAMTFCKWLTRKEREKGAIGPGDAYRLPTEAEWEYACRAGTETARFWGDDGEAAHMYCNGPEPMSTRILRFSSVPFPVDDGYRVSAPVGRFQPNPFGLYDMIGNVFEWCRDRYGPYPSGPVTDPLGLRHSSARIFRGGCWSHGPPSNR